MCLRDTFSNMKCRNECINLLLLLMYVPDIQKILSIKNIQPTQLLYYKCIFLFHITLSRHKSRSLCEVENQVLHFETSQHRFFLRFLEKSVAQSHTYSKSKESQYLESFFKDGHSKVQFWLGTFQRQQTKNSVAFLAKEIIKSIFLFCYSKNIYDPCQMAV